MQQNYIRSIKTRTSIMKRFTFIISFIMLTFMPLMAQVKQTVAVLGDSYSTFEGFIPKGYATWYSPTAPPETTDVNKVEQTWWWQVISVKKICNKYQVPVITFHDIDKKNGHPTIKGMKSIADQVLKVIKK
ncbi:Uncharacterised protein [Segatella copri]|nr:Uncharacterised protein [Segatella copri]